MKNKIFFKGTFYALISTTFLIVNPFASTAQIPPNYNVLFIAVDDMNDRCSFLNSSEVLTPNLQRLVNRGMVFKLGFCQYAMCNPSRTSLLTGWRPDKTQVFSNSTRPRSVISPDVKFLPEYFKTYGYHTERYGKILHAQFENDIAWDYSEPPEIAGGNSNIRNNGFSGMSESANMPGGSWWIDNLGTTVTEDSLSANDLVARMRQPQTQPFFYGLGLHTHNPFTPSLKYWNLNGDPSVQQLLPVDKNGTLSNVMGNVSEPIVLPQTPANDRSDVPSIAFPNPPVIKIDAEWKNTIHAYDGEVAQMDAQLGIVLDEMDRQNLWANTVVVFWSDHGQHLGEHQGLWLKNTIFNEALHVPLIVCVPGKPAGTSSRLVELVDLYPTLAELCGLPAPAGMEGSSFVPLLDNPETGWKKAVFSQVRGTNSIMGRSVLTAQYRYNSWDTAGEELYDHNNDPFEYTNLAGNAAYANALVDMRTILAEGWQKSIPIQCIPQNFYADSDSDGYGNFSVSVQACYAPPGYVSDYTDCNDSDTNIHPNAVELCNGVDDNCNGQIDENLVSASITPTGTINSCTGTIITLTAIGAAGSTYQWLKNGRIISGAIGQTYDGKKSGSYQVQITIGAGCNATSNATTLSFADYPVATITPMGSLDICATDSVVLQANSGTHIKYQWQKKHINIVGATSAKYTAKEAANYDLVVTNSNGCSTVSANTKVTKSCLAIAPALEILSSAKTNSTTELLLHPNPTNGPVTVSYNSDKNSTAILNIYDITGRMIFNKTVNFIKGRNVFNINLASLSSGSYFFELDAGSQQTRVKFIVEK